MTIALDSEIVATRYDAQSRVCFYTIARGGKHWTAKVPLDDLDKHKANKALRRAHLASVLTGIMQGPSDEEIEAARRADAADRDGAAADASP